MVKLVDEAQHDRGAKRVRPSPDSFAASVPAISDRSLEPALEQADRLKHGRFARTRRPKQRHDLAGLTARLTPRSTSIVTPPW
jgi:hypothetical protein